MSQLNSQPRLSLWASVIAVLSTALLGWPAMAEAPSVDTAVSKSSVQVAEPFTFDLTVSAPAATRVVFPSLADRLGEFEVTATQSIFDIPSANSSGQRTWTQRLTLESIVTGELLIPSIEIQVVHDRDPSVLRSQPVPIRVISVLEDRSDPAKFRDIQPVVDVDVPDAPSGEQLWWFIGGASAFAIALGCGLLLRRRNRGLEPQAWALQELEELNGKLQAGQVDTGEVATAVTTILRDYLTLQFAVPESGQTLQEWIDMLESRSSVDQATLKKFRALSSLAEKAKFAGLVLSMAGLQSIVADSRLIVQQIDSESESTTAAPKLTETV